MSLVLFILANYVLFFWLFNRVLVRESKARK